MKKLPNDLLDVIDILEVGEGLETEVKKVGRGKKSRYVIYVNANHDKIYDLKRKYVELYDSKYSIIPTK